MELEEIIQRSKARPEIYAPALAMEALRLEAERDQLLARIEDTDSACADYAFAGAHTAREIIEKLHDRIRGYKTDRDLLAEANDQLRAELAECREAARAAILALAHADEQSPGLYREAYEKLSAALAADGEKP